MDIGDILYFLFIIGGIIYSFIKKSNSKKSESKNKSRNRTTTSSAASGKSSTNTVDDEIEQFLRSISGESKTTKAQTERAQEEAQFNDDLEYDRESSSFQDHNLEELKEEQRQQFTKEEEKLLKKDISANSPIYSGLDTQEQGRKSEFNLRKAVIYDAIMNRPKY